MKMEYECGTIHNPINVITIKETGTIAEAKMIFVTMRFTFTTFSSKKVSLIVCKEFTPVISSAR